MKVSVKSVIESHAHSWVITKILQGRNGQIRIDAKTRFHVADGKNFFSKWVSKKYADRLTLDTFGKRTDEFSCWVY